MSLTVIFVVWVVCAGALFWYARFWVASLVPPTVPVYVGYLLIAAPVVVAEEALTCGDFPNCLLVTVPVFFLHLSAFYLFARYVSLSLAFLIVLYGVWGSVHEFFISGKWGEFAEHGVFVLLIMLGLNTLIYAVISILPLAYVVSRKRGC